MCSASRDHTAAVSTVTSSALQPARRARSIAISAPWRPPAK